MSILDLKVRKVLEIAAEVYTTFCVVITSSLIFGLIMHTLTTWMYSK
jgi:hypothetical protein